MGRTLVSVALLACLWPAELAAKSWKGLTPGVTTRTQVINKYGEPSKSFSKGGKLSDGLNYQGEEAIEGALETNFYFDKHEVLFRIDIFPAREINAKDVERIFGADYTKKQTKRGHIFFHYAKDGMIVFFSKDSDKVHSFIYTLPSAEQDDKKKPDAAKSKVRRPPPPRDDETSDDETSEEADGP
ncbi:MAG: hypothetical protein JXR96_04740 [Deltaproteobacteria bacterium]|nr:hypothetical protein [Deltaproteobacteria bacterium]